AFATSRSVFESASVKVLLTFGAPQSVCRFEFEHHIWDTWHDTVLPIDRPCGVRALSSQQSPTPVPSSTETPVIA
ncbi:MAG: hypothetical protein AAFW76_10940, partial [Pseudomonadota bacterium]